MLPCLLLHTCYRNDDVRDKGMSRRWSSQRNHRFSVAVLLPLVVCGYFLYRLTNLESDEYTLPYSYGEDDLASTSTSRAGGNGLAAWARLRPTGANQAARDAEALLERLLRVPAEEAGKIAVCASLFNEGRWLTEWLLYNRAIGVDRFYLYDTGSTDDTLEVLQPWMEAGTVKLHRFNQDQGGHFQMNSLQTCTRTYANETDWILDTDVDEFYVATPALSSQARRRPLLVTEMPDKPLLKLLEENWLYQDSDAVVASRVTFKNSGIQRLPDEASVLATQTLRDIYHSISYDKLKFTKSIVHTRHTAGWVIPGAHYLQHPTINASDAKIISADGQRVEPDMLADHLPAGQQGTLYKGRTNSRAYEPLLMYHFVERDLENCLEKLRRVSLVRKGGWRHQAGEEGCRSYEMYQPNDQWIPVHEKDSFYGGAVKDVSMADSWYGQHLPNLIHLSLTRAHRLVTSAKIHSASAALPYQPHMVDPHPDMIEEWRERGFDLVWGEAPQEVEERLRWEAVEGKDGKGAEPVVEPPAAAKVVMKFLDEEEGGKTEDPLDGGAGGRRKLRRRDFGVPHPSLL